MSSKLRSNTAADSIITVNWLANRVHSDGIQIIDASWYLPTQQRNPIVEFQTRHIPGAIHVDIDYIAAPSSGPPHRMLPSPEDFAEKASIAGLNPEAHIIIYDQSGLYGAARLWWMLKVYQHKQVSVLSGGLPAYEKAGLQLESGMPEQIQMFEWPIKQPIPNSIRTWQEVLININTKEEQIVDVRPKSIFDGNATKTHHNVRVGHIPGAINLPLNSMLESGHLISPEKLETLIMETGIDIRKPVVASCGSGVTACALALAFSQMGRELCPIYDGSWEEWSGKAELPTEIN